MLSAYDVTLGWGSATAQLLAFAIVTWRELIRSSSSEGSSLSRTMGG